MHVTINIQSNKLVKMNESNTRRSVDAYQLYNTSMLCTLVLYKQHLMVTHPYSSLCRPVNNNQHKPLAREIR